MAKISLGSLLLISTIEHVLSRYACEVLVGQRPGKISRWARIFQITISSMVEKSRNPPFVAALPPKPDSPMKIEDALLGRRLIGALVELIRSDQSVYDVLCVLTNLVAGTSDTGSELLLESLGILEIYGMLENEKYRNDAKIGEQAFWLIGNIVRDSKRICQLCYRQGVHQALFTFFDRSLRSQNLPVLRKIVWSMNGLLHMHIEPIIETSMVERMVSFGNLRRRRASHGDLRDGAVLATTRGVEIGRQGSGFCRRARVATNGNLKVIVALGRFARRPKSDWRARQSGSCHGPDRCPDQYGAL